MSNTYRQKRRTYTVKETYIFGKRDLLTRQKRPTHKAKETYYAGIPRFIERVSASMVSGDLNFRFLPPVMVLRAAHAACVCVCMCVKERERACVCVRACVSERERERERERRRIFVYMYMYMCVYYTHVHDRAQAHTRTHNTTFCKKVLRKCRSSAISTCHAFSKLRASANVLCKAR